MTEVTPREHPPRQVRRRRLRPGRRTAIALVCIALALAAGVVGGITSGSPSTW